MNNAPKRITVFGGSKPRPGEPAYLEAYQLGYLAGKAGHTVLTGGYMGTMEAIRGAHEAGGHVIGVTCEESNTWRPTRANPWVQEEWRYAYPGRERLILPDRHCDAALALPGGAGTMAEVSLTWNCSSSGRFRPGRSSWWVTGPGMAIFLRPFYNRAWRVHLRRDQKLL